MTEAREDAGRAYEELEARTAEYQDGLRRVPH